MGKKDPNPFRFGALALGGAFTDRQAELRELVAEMQNGQDVLVYAPRRYGKSSLVLRAASRAGRDGALVGYVDLLKVTSKERLAAALARTIHRDLDTPSGRTYERAAELFRSLRIVPTMEVDPQDGSLAFSFRATRHRTDIDDTIESLLELLARIGTERRRQVVMIFDEFQEIVELDARYPNLLRAVFQTQPDVAHIYLGSKRHVLDRIFGDRNEPFWRSAKKMEIGLIGTELFARFVCSRFDRTDKGITEAAAARLVALTAGHPYGTQELAHEVWERTPSGAFAYESDVDAGLERVLRAEHNHLEQLWADAPRTQRRLLGALAAEPTPSPYAEDYRTAFDLPAAPTLQSALTALIRKELVGRVEDGTLAIIEPFLAAWVRREAA